MIESLISVEDCHMLAIFKDYLIWDDLDLQCVKRSYGEDAKERLKLLSNIP